MLQRAIPSTIRGRLAATFVAMSILLVLAFGAYLSTVIEGRYRSEVERDLFQRAQIARAAIVGSAGGLQPGAILSSLGADVGTSYALVDSNGAIVASNVQLGEVVLLEPAQLAAGAFGERDGRFFTWLPLDDGSGGTLWASQSTSELNGAVAEIRRRVIVTSVIASLLSLLVALAVARKITDPLDELQRHSALVAGGQLDAAVNPADTQELGELGRALNAMTRRIRDLVEESARTRVRLETIFANLGDGVVIVDTRQNVITMNPMAASTFGTRVSEAAGKPFVVAVRDADLQRLLATAFDTSSRATGTIEYVRTGKVFDAAAQPVLSGNERLGIVVVRDVTELRRLETVRREFVANVSHELRTPLASIRALVETLDAGAIDDPEVSRDFFGRVIGEVDRLTGLVDELLDLARLESGRLVLKLAPITPEALVHGGVERLQAQIDRAKLTLAVEVEDDLPVVSVDRARIEQVLLNLIHNAIKFTPPGGRITVRAGRESDWVAIAVADTGSGISAVELPRVFERFYKSDRARRSEGTGLGLAIAKHIVQAHGGSIRVESVVGEGATFTFTLPAATDGTAAPNEETAPIPVGASR